MRVTIVGAFVVLLVAVFATGASAEPKAYDGHNPFTCVLQQVGTGTNFPFPDADPFCVEFDKTHQNVTELGVVDFLAQEPARVAAAGPKCFYYQRDHWTGSIAQGQSPETYHFDGSYFFDKARGEGGAYVENLRIGGQPADPTLLPGFPDQLKQYFSGGRGGYESGDSVQADPACGTKNPSPGSGPPPANSKCRVPGGRIGRGLGGVHLGATRKRTERDLGSPTKAGARYLVWCLDGGGRIVAATTRARVRLVLTDNSAFDTRGIRVGTRTHRARTRMRHERRLRRVGGARVYTSRERRRQLYVGFGHGRVTWIAAGARNLSPRAARTLLRGTPAP